MTDIIEAEDSTPKPPKRYLIGLDLGQMSDFSALAVVEQHIVGKNDVMLHCRHLQRWPLRTSYTDIVADVDGLVRKLAGRGVGRNILCCDVNGPGQPVIDLLKKKRMPATVISVFSHGGDRTTVDGDTYRVPKRELVAKTQFHLQNGTLKIAAGLPEAGTLVSELQGYTMAIDPATAHDSYGAWRTGTHDDLLFALMLPVWCADVVKGPLAMPPLASCMGSVKVKLAVDRRW